MAFFRKKRATVDEVSPEPAAAPEPAPAPPKAPQRAAAPAKPPEPPKPSYGIDDAIALMRDLPETDNIALVVQVIKRTLESMRVDVAAIIEDGITKQHSLENQVKTLQREIASLLQELAQRREEIASLRADQEETHSVRVLLLGSKSLAAPAPPPPPPPPSPRDESEPSDSKQVDDGWKEDTDVPVTVDAGAIERAR